MARAQSRSKRKVSGGRYHPARGKKKVELAGFAANTRLSERKVKSIRTLGGSRKQKLLSAHEVNVADKNGKFTKTKILTVLENAANPHLVRRNIITKGAVVKTDLGKVKITSRPGQEGTVNGVLLQ